MLARAVLADAGYGLQAEARPPIDGLVDAALLLAAGLERLAAALKQLAERLRAQLEDVENPPEAGLRQRLDATIRRLERRADMQLAAWASCCAISPSRRDPTRSSGSRSIASTDWRAMSGSSATGSILAFRLPRWSRSRRTGSS